MQITDYFSKDFLSRYGEDLDALREALDEGAERFRKAVAGLDEAALNAPTAPNKWSPLEIADHLRLTDLLLASAVRQATSGEGVPRMAMGRVTEEGRPIAPRETSPRTGHPPGEVMAGLEASWRGLREAGERAGREGAGDAPALIHAFLGPLTVIECLQLSAWHRRHHARQVMRRVAEG